MQIITFRSYSSITKILANKDLTENERKIYKIIRDMT